MPPPSAVLPITDDDAAIAAALEDLSVPTLLVSLVHLTGDASILAGPLRPVGIYLNEVQGFMSPDELAAARAVGIPVLKRAVAVGEWVHLGRVVAVAGTHGQTTTTALSITTAGTALVPGGTYDVRVACVRSGTAAIRSLLQELGPFSNTLRFVMPAAGAPFLAVSATTPTTATATIQPPAGTGKGWQILGSFCTGFPDRQPHMKPLSNPMLPITFHRMEELPADNLPAGRARNQLPQCAVRHPCERLRSDQPCRWHNLHCHSRGHPGRWRHKPGKQHRNVHHLPRGAAHPVRRYLHRRQHLLQK